MNDQSSDSPMKQRLQSQKSAFAAAPFPALKERIDKLDRIIAMTARYQPELVDAARADFGNRSAAETTMVEVFGTTANAKNTRRRLSKWMRLKKVPTAPPFRPGYNRLMSQPVGVVGIISPWNLAYNLAIAPAISAIAAGNRVMLKPSEITPNTAALIASMVAEYFDPDEFDVFTGGADVAAEFAGLPFDHLLYTGSTAVGRKVALAAAQNLTPVTLELGGKSPVIIDRSADLDEAAKRLAFAKMFNGGQICIAPDYVLVPSELRDQLALRILKHASTFYPDAMNNDDYCSIVTDGHFARLEQLLAEAEIAGTKILGDSTASASESRRMPLQLLLDPKESLTVMQEEIFGPLLPIVSYEQHDDALAYVAARPRPLALYWFGKDKARRAQVLRESISGGVTINDAIWHFAQEDQPFGGVGPSGIGAYHGEAGFLAFSKEKPVFYAPSWPYSLAMFHPPYTERTLKLLNFLRKIV